MKLIVNMLYNDGGGEEDEHRNGVLIRFLPSLPTECPTLPPHHTPPAAATVVHRFLHCFNGRYSAVSPASIVPRSASPPEPSPMRDGVPVIDQSLYGFIVDNRVNRHFGSTVRLL